MCPVAMRGAVDCHYGKLRNAGESTPQHQRPVVTLVAATPVAEQHQRYGLLDQLGGPHDAGDRTLAVLDDELALGYPAFVKTLVDPL